MRRLRILRYLIPALLIPFLVWVIVAFRPQRGPAPVANSVTETAGGARAEGFSFNDYVEGTKRLFAAAKSGQMNADGSFRVEDLSPLELYREGAPPLVLSAAKGAGAGPEGRRVIRLDGGVKIDDAENGMSVTLPSLEVEQGSGVVRSLGEVRLESPTFRGSAQSVVYGLKGQPTELFAVRFEFEPGGAVVAQRGFLYRQSRELELRGEVRGTQAGSQLEADSVRLFRSPEGKLERVEASGSARGTVARPDEASARFGADGAEIYWDGPRVDRLRLAGAAWIERSPSRIAADRIEARSAGPDGARTVTAEGSVTLGGLFRGAPGSLRSARVDAELDADGRLVRGEARGGVRFEGRDSSGSCDRAVYAADAVGGTVSLFSSGDERARLASGRTRIAADRIDSAPDGSRLDAQGNVESTLLPEPSTTPMPAGAALFSARDAVHFVSTSLHSTGQGKTLEFKGSVRGWQADRSLAADVVSVDDAQDALSARGSVNTRMPRSKGVAAGEADYLQVSAESLDYDGKTGRGVYRGAVRVRQAEGRMESERLEIDVAQGGDVREVRGFGSIRFDTQTVAADGSVASMNGSGDRVVYDPQARTVRLFGDKRPAEIRRTGKQAGTTTGRALLYRLDDGGIEVESGDRNRAKIKTGR